MTTIEHLHKPRWQQDGDNWLMIVGNRAVATLITNSDDLFPQYIWLSVILAESRRSFECCSVDFTSLGCAQYDLEQWWHYAARGQRYNPRLHRNCPDRRCRAGT